MITGHRVHIDIFSNLFILLLYVFVYYLSTVNIICGASTIHTVDIFQFSRSNSTGTLRSKRLCGKSHFIFSHLWFYSRPAHAHIYRYYVIFHARLTAVASLTEEAQRTQFHFGKFYLRNHAQLLFIFSFRLVSIVSALN